MIDTSNAESVLDKNAERLMSIHGVESVGVGMFKGGACIMVTVSSPEPEVQASIPTKLDGVPVRVEVGGRAEAY